MKNEKILILILILILSSINCLSQNIKIDSCFFSYSSRCNIKIDFFDKNKLIITKDNQIQKCIIQKSKTDRGYYEVYNNKILINIIGFLNDEVYLVNQHYEIGCESSKVLLLNKLYSIKKNDFEDYYNDLDYVNEEIEVINNKAFYLKKYKDYEISLLLLDKVIEKSPTRVVAYLNIADCYWEMKDKPKAIENYKKYIQLMTEQNKDLNKIPKYVYERVK
jgi:tetratricopeptide (TPR) repeat protein